ncbi:MAG: helix-turn-helix transcriptional regulator [Balneolaceae bacterium]
MTDGKDIEKAFGQVVRDMRLERKLSQEKLSELSGLDRSYVSEIERGEKTASIRTLVKLAEGLGISLSSLIVDMEKKLKLL